MRVGIGFDIHRLVPGRRFVMGGVEIPYDRGPLGHSDGDALCHAIADALLGACAMGDIGLWFPPDDESYQGADSLDLIKKVSLELNKAGFEICNIDSLVICEKPKLSPYYNEMRKRIAGALAIQIEDVSVKATTYEKLGEIGAGEAVAAKAVALVKKQ